MNKKRSAILIYSIRLSIGILVLTLLIYFVGINEIVMAWENYETKWLFLAATVIIFTTVFGAYNLYLIIKINLPIGFLSFLPGYWLAWAVGLVMPGQVGDILGLTYWMQKKGFKWEITSGIAIIDKSITFFWMFSLAVIGIIIYFQDFRYIFYICIILFFCLLLLLLFIIFFSKKNSSKFLPKVFISFFVEIKQTIAKSKMPIFINFVLTPVKVVFTAIAYLIIFRAANVITIDLLDIILIVSVTSLVSYIPISFNGIGTVESVAVVAFSMFDIKAAIVVSVFIILRLIVILLAWLPASIYLVFTANSVDQRFR